MHLRRAIHRIAIEMRPLRRTAMLGMIAVLGIGVGTGGARAQSGDFPVNPGNPGEVPTYTIPAESCDDIREAIVPGSAAAVDSTSWSLAAYRAAVSPGDRRPATCWTAASGRQCRRAARSMPGQLSDSPNHAGPG